MSEWEDQSLALPRLVGDECDQVWFVRDYAIVQLERTSITCVSGPEIDVAGSSYQFPGAGSRDALCALIDNRVQSAVQRNDGTVEIGFDGGVTLRVSPWAEDPRREFIYIAARN